MNRASFIKSLFVVAAAPKIVSEINLTPQVISFPTTSLINDLNLLTPTYYKKYVEKYGNMDWEWWLTSYGKEQTEHKNIKEYMFYETGGTI